MLLSSPSMFAFAIVSNFRIRLSILSSSYCYSESNIVCDLEIDREIDQRSDIQTIFLKFFFAQIVLSLACNFFLIKRILDMNTLRHLRKVLDPSHLLIFKKFYIILLYLQDFSYDEDYYTKVKCGEHKCICRMYFISQWVLGDAGGPGLEYHEFDHIDMPLHQVRLKYLYGDQITST